MFYTFYKNVFKDKMVTDSSWNFIFWNKNDTKMKQLILHTNPNSEITATFKFKIYTGQMSNIIKTCVIGFVLLHKRN